MNKKNKIHLFLLIFLLYSISLLTKAAKDNVRLIPNTPDYESFMNKKDCSETINVQRAWIYSALLPGLGQVYNKQISRSFVIWGVFAALFGGVYYCHAEYTKYFHANSLNVPSFVEPYKKVRDSLLFVSLVWYVANILDAYVGAKLLTYDISDNVAVQVVPYVHSSLSNSESVGVSLGFIFG